MIVDRQTYTQTDRHAHHNTRLPYRGRSNITHMMQTELTNLGTDAFHFAHVAGKHRWNASSLHLSTTCIEVITWVTQPHTRNAVKTFISLVSTYYCRMAKYELLRWLVEMLSRDVDHYPMINASRPTVYHYNVTKCNNKIYSTLFLLMWYMSYRKYFY